MGGWDRLDPEPYVNLDGPLDPEEAAERVGVRDEADDGDEVDDAEEAE